MSRASGELLRRRRRWGWSALLLALSLQLAACVQGGGGPTPAPTLLRISGATTMQPALEDLAGAYQLQRPHMLVEVSDGGSSIGLSGIQSGQADLAAISWQPDGEELPPGLAAFPIARDAIAVVVHPSNQAPGLTLLQLRACFRGEILDWATVDGSSGEPVLVSREDGSGTRAAFEALVMGGDRVTLNALVMPSSQAVVEYVASHRHAIGYVSMASLSDRVRTIAVEDALPTAENVRSGIYHLTRLLYLYAPTPVTPATQDFLSFALGPIGQAIFARHHAALR